MTLEGHPRRAKTRISTACSWLNIDGSSLNLAARQSAALILITSRTRRIARLSVGIQASFTKPKGVSYGSQKRSRHPGDIISEWWATSPRNAGRDHLGIMGDIERNQHWFFAGDQQADTRCDRAFHSRVTRQPKAPTIAERMSVKSIVIR